MRASKNKPGKQTGKFREWIDALAVDLKWQDKIDKTIVKAIACKRKLIIHNEKRGESV